MKKSQKRILALTVTCALLFSSLIGGSMPASADMANGSTDVAYEAAAEGIVLLKNDNNVLPLSSDQTISIFGRTQVDTIKGGTGSGNVNVDYTINILDGIRGRGDIAFNESLAATYEAWCEEHPTGESESGSLGLMGGAASYPEMYLDDALVEAAAAASDVAVVTIGRISGEGTDRQVAAGDYYLTAGEKTMLSKVTKYFDKVAVILNIGGVIDMNWVDTYGIDSVLLTWQAGIVGGYVVADALSGVINPSGKLTDTFAYDYSDYPAGSIGTFGEAAKDLDGDVKLDPVYNEDIYVGYRYFETFEIPVKYEFGYGLSYTTFSREITGFSANADTVTVKVKVTNTGDAAGKEVAQVYFSAPQGKLGKASKELASYAKTDELKPGEYQVLTITYDTSDMSSYDDSGKVAKSAYVLEAGNYTVYAGNSLKSITKAGTYTVAENTITEQLTERMAATTEFNRLLANGTYEAVPQRTIAYADVVYDVPEEITYTGDKGYKLADVYNGTVTMEQFVAQLNNDDLVYLTQGRGMDLNMGDYIFTDLTDNTDGTAVVGAAGAYGYLTKYGIPTVTTADGPAGVRIDLEVNGGTTAFPIGTMLACTWNEVLLEKTGDMIGQELAVNGVDVWLAPGMNIHRDPLCGRNFEYYSEDPLVTGVTAAAITRGVQANGAGVTLKHYAVNNQETDRSDGNSIVSERAIREIYLKGFEIAVKSSDPWYVMTSYNRINGSFAASNYDLCTYILRNEWGFVGTVMTDWTAHFDDGTASMIRAQNDLLMPGSMYISSSNLDLEADVKAGKVTVAEVQRSIINILNSAIKSLKFSEENNVTDNLAYSSPANWFSVAKSVISVVPPDQSSDPSTDPSTDSSGAGSTSGTSSSDGNGTSSTSGSSTTSPKTGDYSTIVFAMVLLSLLGVVTIVSKRKKHMN